MDDKKIIIEVALTGQEAEAFCDHITFNIYQSFNRVELLTS